jgi:hypothetical protein
VVVAVSDEPDELVADYLDSMGIEIPVGAGSPASGKYGVKGIPHSVLIDPTGKVAWSGSPYSLSKGTVKAALKGARKRSANFLAIPVEGAATGRLAAPAKAMEAGSLGKALPALLAIADDAKATEAEQSEAKKLAASIEDYVKLLNAQAETFVSARDVLKGLLVLDTLAKEFSGSPIGDAAKKRAESIRKDEGLAREIAGAEAFQRAQEQAAKLGTTKAKAKYQDVVEKFKGTRAAERAAAILRGGGK